MKLAYDSVTLKKVIPITDIYSQFIDATAEPVGCGVVTCDLWHWSSNVAYNSNSANNEITIDGSTFAVSVRQDLAAGYGIKYWRVRCKSSTLTSYFKMSAL